MSSEYPCQELREIEEGNDGDPNTSATADQGEGSDLHPAFTTAFETFGVLFCCKTGDANYELPLQENTYALMFLTHTYSCAFWYGFVIAFLQIGFALLGAYNTVEKTNHCDIERDVNLEVQALQFISLLLPLYTIESIAKTIPMALVPASSQLLVKARVREGEQEEEALLESDIWKWRISLWLRIALCVVIYGANIIMVLASNKVSEVLINFTILVFIFNWSSIALKLTSYEYNVFPKCLSCISNDIKGVTKRQINGQDTSVKISNHRLRYNRKEVLGWTMLLTVVVLAVSICLWLIRHEYIEDYFEDWQGNCEKCYRFQVQINKNFIDSSGNYAACDTYAGQPIYQREFGIESHQFLYCKEDKEWLLVANSPLGSFRDRNKFKCIDYLAKGPLAIKTTDEETTDEKINILQKFQWTPKNEGEDEPEVDFKCLEFKTNRDIKKTIKDEEGICNKENFTNFIDKEEFICDELLHYKDNDDKPESYTFSLLLEQGGKVLTAYNRPVYKMDNKMNYEIILFNKNRWYHMMAKNKDILNELKAVKRPTQWNEAFQKWNEAFQKGEKGGNIKYVSQNVFLENVPTGSLKWYNYQNQNITRIQRFECLSKNGSPRNGCADPTKCKPNIDCSKKDVCKKNGICVENMLLEYDDDMLENDDFIYCSEAMIDSSQYVCGGKCFCDPGYSGTFCQIMEPTQEPTPEPSPVPLPVPSPEPSPEPTPVPTPSPAPVSAMPTLTGCQRVQVDFSSDVYKFQDIDLTEHLMQHSDSYAFFGIDNFNRASPPDLHFSHFSGAYIKGEMGGIPIYKEDREDAYVHGMFYYCTNYKAWVFTIIPLAIENGIVPNVTKAECGEYGWFMRSSRVESLSLDMAPGTDWTIWTGISAVNSDVTITCMECQVHSDCSLGHGKCNSETNMCNCTQSFEGPFCERSEPCLEIVKYDGTLENVTLSNERDNIKITEHEIMHGPFSRRHYTRKIHNRNVFMWDNTYEIELILYSGFRWYHMNMTKEYYEDNFEDNLMMDKVDTYWSNILLDLTRYYSEETQNYIPTGNLQWFHNHKDNTLDLFDDSVQFNQQFECLDVNCDICGFHAKNCSRNVVLVKNDVLVTTGNETCDRTMEMSNDDYICGNRCDCKDFYDGHFCENKVFD